MIRAVVATLLVVGSFSGWANEPEAVKKRAVDTPFNLAQSTQSVTIVGRRCWHTVDVGGQPLCEEEIERFIRSLTDGSSAKGAKALMRPTPNPPESPADGEASEPASDGNSSANTNQGPD